MVTLLLANAATVLLLIGIITREVWQVVQARRRGRAAARLHVRIVGLFSLVAAAPAILVAIVATSRSTAASTACSPPHTRSAIENSLIVAEAYLREHAQIVRADIMVHGLSTLRATNRCSIRIAPSFRQFLTAPGLVRGLSPRRS